MNKFLFLAIGILFIGNVFALSEIATNVSSELDVAYKDVLELKEKGFAISRINDSYSDALSIFDAQVLLEKSNRYADYSLVRKYISDVKHIKELALLSKDKIEIFLSEYDSINKSLDLSEMDDDYSMIIRSFEEERYEETLELVPKGYEKLNSIQSSQTAMNIFYESTTLGIKKFFYATWKYFLAAILLLIVFWVFFNKPIRKYFISRKISSLENRRKSVKGLMEKLQKEYFDSKKISESEYSIKMKSFSDMVLDISRRILLLKEEVERMNKIGKKKSNIKKRNLRV